MKIGPLNHVGVAVPNIEEAMDNYRKLYGATDFVKPFIMEAQGVRVAFVNLPNSQIELIEPYGETSPIRNFLQKNPKGGQHHICFEVNSVAEAIEDAISEGASIIGEPRIGAHGTLMVFIHPKHSNGVLIELMEPAKH